MSVIHETSVHIGVKSVQFISVAQSCLTLCNPIDWSIPGFPVHHQHTELAQTHVIESVMPSNHLILCHHTSPPAFYLSQYQGHFQWVSSLPQVTKALELQLQHQFFPWILRTDFFKDWMFWSPCSPRDYQNISSTPQFKSISSLAHSFLYGPTLILIQDYWKNHNFD